MRSFACFLALGAALALAGCKSNKPAENSTANSQPPATAPSNPAPSNPAPGAAMTSTASAPDVGVPPGPKPVPPGNYTATIQTDKGDIEIQLFAKEAPVTVGNFVGLAQGTQDWNAPGSMRLVHNKPFYDGLTFHRVIPQFMIQGGDPMGTGSGGPGYQFGNEIAPDLTFDRPGRVAMAKTDEPISDGSQFFITVAPYPFLNGKYTIFGQVTSGQSVADAISQLPRDSSDKPLTAVHIVKITIHKG